MIKPSFCSHEDFPCCGCGEPDMSPEEIFERETERREAEELYDYGGFPGDGSGMDDLADFNANEAADYADEGADYDTPMAEDYGGE